MTVSLGLETAISKMSWRLLPLLALGYGLSFIDRINISFAAPQMNHELGFSASVYGLGAGLFFLGYALFEIPANLLLVRIGARRWLAGLMVAWGLIAAGMAGVRTQPEFYAARFLLGLAEAGFFPGVLLYLSSWFPAQARGRSISRFYVAGPLSLAVMGVLSTALLKLDGRLNLRGWQWLLMVEGAPAVLLGICLLRWLPDAPEQAAWLSAEERSALAAALAADNGPAEPRTRLFAALTNPTVIAFAAIGFLTLGPFYAFNLSAPAVLQGLAHMSLGQIGALTSVAGLASAVFMLTAGWSLDLHGRPVLHVMAPLMVIAAAFTAMGLLRTPLVFPGGYALALAAVGALTITVWGPPSRELPAETRAAGFAAITMTSQFGSFLCPTLWGLARDATGGYDLGLKLLPVPMFVAMAALWLWSKRGTPPPNAKEAALRREPSA